MRSRRVCRACRSRWLGIDTDKAHVFLLLLWCVCASERVATCLHTTKCHDVYNVVHKICNKRANSLALAAHKNIVLKQLIVVFLSRLEAGGWRDLARRNGAPCVVLVRRRAIAGVDIDFIGACRLAQQGPMSVGVVVLLSRRRDRCGWQRHPVPV